MTLDDLGPPGQLRPITIELHESSGPVSPRYQYHLQLVVEAVGETITLKGEIKAGAASSWTPRLLDQPISYARYQELWGQLLAQEVLTRTADLIGQKRDRVGVSFNYCEVKVEGCPSVRFDYLLAQLDDERCRPWAAIVSALKQLVN